MMKKILTSLVLLSLICVVLVGAETSGLSSTSVGGQNSNQDNIGSDSTNSVICNAGQKIGDLNNDNKISASDLVLIENIVSGTAIKPTNICCVDINQDGKVAVSDQVKLSNIIAGLDKSPGVCAPVVECKAGQIIGDLYGDGKIVASDLVLMENIVAGFSPAPSNICCADVNQDGKIAVSDQVKLSRIISGLESSPGKCPSSCQGVEYNNNCYLTYFAIKEGDTFYTQKEVITVESIEGSHCGEDENGQRVCTNTISSVDLRILARCSGDPCPTYYNQVTLLQGEDTKLEFTKILLKLKGTDVNVDPSTANFEIIFTTSLPPGEVLSEQDRNSNTWSCPAGCICNEDSNQDIVCPSESEPTITTQVQSGTSSQDTSGTSNPEETSTTSTISLSKTGTDKTSIQSGNVEVVTSEKVSVTNSKLVMETLSGSTKEINVMPEEVSAILGTSSIATTELKEESEKAIYSVSGTKSAKVIAIFPVEMNIQAKVSAETGEIISIEKPWWSFLAKEE